MDHDYNIYLVIEKEKGNECVQSYFTFRHHCGLFQYYNTVLSILRQYNHQNE